MNYLTNYYKNLAKELQEKLSNLQEQYNAILNEEKKEEKPLAEPSTKEGSEAKRVPLNIKTKKTDPKEEKEKVEKEDMVMKEESSIGYNLENSIRAILKAQLNEVKITKIVNGKVVKYNPSEKSEDQATKESGAYSERDQIVQDIEAEEGSGRYTKEYLQAKAQEKLNRRQRHSNAVRVAQNTVETGGTTRPGGESTFEQGKYSTQSDQDIIDRVNKETQQKEKQEGINREIERRRKYAEQEAQRNNQGPSAGRK